MKSKHFVFFWVVLFVNSACKDSNQKNSHLAYVMASHYGFFIDPAGNYYDDRKSVIFNGQLYSETLPSLQMVRAGDSIYQGAGFFDYQYGHASFSSFNRFTRNYYALTERLDTFQIEIKSSEGLVKASVVLPDSVKNITATVLDTLKLGNSFTLSWQSLRSDFVYLIADYFWRDSNGSIQYTPLDTFISQDSIKFPQSQFNFDGAVLVETIIPFAGPLPIPGAKSNIHGNGGFIFYMRNDNEDAERLIIVGNGLFEAAYTKLSDKEINIRLRKKLGSQFEVDNLNYSQY